MLIRVAVACLVVCWTFLSRNVNLILKCPRSEIVLFLILKFSFPNARFQNLRFSRLILTVLQAFEVGLFCLKNGRLISAAKRTRDF